MIGTYRIIRRKSSSTYRTYRPYIYSAQYLKWGFWWRTLESSAVNEAVPNSWLIKNLENTIKAHAILKNGKEVERYSFDHDLFKELTSD